MEAVSKPDVKSEETTDNGVVNTKAQNGWEMLWESISTSEYDVGEDSAGVLKKIFKRIEGRNGQATKIESMTVDKRIEIGAENEGLIKENTRVVFKGLDGMYYYDHPSPMVMDFAHGCTINGTPCYFVRGSAD